MHLYNINQSFSDWENESTILVGLQIGWEILNWKFELIELVYKNNYSLRRVFEQEYNSENKKEFKEMESDSVTKWSRIIVDSEQVIWMILVMKDYFKEYRWISQIKSVE